MRAKTFPTSAAARWLAVALIALAPLACIEFCRVTHEMAHQAHDQTVMMHGDNAPQAPLADMQQLVRAVTDALPFFAMWFALLVIIAIQSELRFHPIQLAHAPPTPPPKRFALNFLLREINW